MYDFTRIGVAVIPLALYALILGVINLRSRPFLATGSQDAVALGGAAGGFILIGPMELLLPQTAYHNYEGFVFVMLASLYGLCLTLYVLTARPCLIIYNISLDEFRPALSQAFDALKADARWAGNTVSLPSLGIEMHVSSFGVLRNVQLSPVGLNQSLTGWRRLELALNDALRTSEVRRNSRGAVYVAVGTLMILLSTAAICSDRQALVEAIRDVFSG
ncbi:MAG: hypothetical protein N2C14_32390 [Planctomycetales bacterium]